MNIFGPELPWVVISIGGALIGFGVIVGVEKILNRRKKIK